MTTMTNTCCLSNPPTHPSSLFPTMTAAQTVSHWKQAISQGAVPTLGEMITETENLRKTLSDDRLHRNFLMPKSNVTQTILHLMSEGEGLEVGGQTYPEDKLITWLGEDLVKLFIAQYVRDTADPKPNDPQVLIERQAAETAAKEILTIIKESQEKGYN